VVGELGMVGDVGQVFEYLGPRATDDDRDGNWIHGARSLCGARSAHPPRYGSVCLRGAADPNRVAALEVAHALAAGRLLAAERPTQLADDRVAGVQMDAFADERRAAAVGAAMAVGRERPNAAPQQQALQLGDLSGDGATAVIDRTPEAVRGQW
jgi:hypothetical protein